MLALTQIVAKCVAGWDDVGPQANINPSAGQHFRNFDAFPSGQRPAGPS